MPAFGFSVGDFIAAIELCTKIAKALKDTGGASSEFQDVVIELQGLQSVLTRVAALDPNESNIEHVDAIRSMALSCQPPLQKFLSKLQKYESTLSSLPTRNFQAGHKVKWALHMVDEVEKIRALLSARTNSISLRLAIHTSEALSRLESRSGSQNDRLSLEIESHRQDLNGMLSKMDETKDALADDISATKTALKQRLEDVSHETNDVKQNVVSLTVRFTSFQASLVSLRNVCSEMLTVLRKLPADLLSMLSDIRQTNMQMYALLLRIANSIPASPTWLLDSNIRFEDALGIVWELPYEYFKHWEIFKTMLCCKFKGKPGERKIRNDRFLILNTKIPGEVISKDDWDQVVGPGSHLHMSIILARFYSSGSICPRPGCKGTTIHARIGLPTEGCTMRCDQCGLKSTRIAKEQSDSSVIDFQDFTSTDMVMSLPSVGNRGERKMNSDQDFQSEIGGHQKKVRGESARESPERRRRIAVRNIAVLTAVVKASISLRKLVIRLRKREEQELRAFKTVHVSTSSIETSKPVNTVAPERDLLRLPRIDPSSISSLPSDEPRFHSTFQLNKHGGREQTFWTESEIKQYNHAQYGGH